MKTNYLNVILISLFLFSCSNEDLCVKENFLFQNDSKDGLEVAVTKAKNSLRSINLNNTTTKSGTLQNIDNLTVLNHQKRTYSIDLENNSDYNLKTKNTSSSSDVNTTDSISVYLFDFENNGRKGFSIASDDYRLPHAIAIVENGNLSDTVFNEGLALYINSLDRICKEQLIKYRKDKANPSVNTRLLGYYSPLKPEIFTNTRYRISDDDWMDLVENEITEGYVTKDVGPLLKTQWLQKAPYNNKCNGGKSPAGCVPIATAQIMAYFKKPYTASYWDELTERTFVLAENLVLADRVSTLLYNVGKGVKVSYGSNESGAYFKDVAPYLQSVGINCKFITKYDTNLIIKNLDESKPVMLAGKRTNAFLGIFYKNGHAWIVDGHYSFKYLVTQKVTQYILGRTPSSWEEWNYYERSYWSDATYYHLNWGWGGYSDGYYTTINYSKETDDYYKHDHRMIVF